MRITLENQGEAGTALVTTEWDDAREDQTIDGTRWEFNDSFAYAVLLDRPSLLAELEVEYEVDAGEYAPPCWVETLWGLLDLENGSLVMGAR